jgi:hypothetical protein
MIMAEIVGLIKEESGSFRACASQEWPVCHREVVCHGEWFALARCRASSNRTPVDLDLRKSLMEPPGTP